MSTIETRPPVGPLGMMREDGREVVTLLADAGRIATRRETWRGVLPRPSSHGWAGTFVTWAAVAVMAVAALGWMPWQR